MVVQCSSSHSLGEKIIINSVDGKPVNQPAIITRVATVGEYIKFCKETNVRPGCQFSYFYEVSTD